MIQYLIFEISLHNILLTLSGQIVFSIWRKNYFSLETLNVAIQMAKITITEIWQIGQ